MAAPGRANVKRKKNTIPLYHLTRVCENIRTACWERCCAAPALRLAPYVRFFFLLRWRAVGVSPRAPPAILHAALDAWLGCGIHLVGIITSRTLYRRAVRSHHVLKSSLLGISTLGDHLDFTIHQARNVYYHYLI